MELDPVWNHNSKHIVLGASVTDSLSTAESDLINFQVGSATKYRVSKQGVQQLGGVTFASLPTPVAGMQAYITDGLAANCGDASCTTFGTTITGGGGALKLLAWYNGTNWTLIGK